MEKNITESVGTTPTRHLKVSIFCADVPLTELKFANATTSFLSLTDVNNSSIIADVIFLFNASEVAQHKGGEFKNSQDCPIFIFNTTYDDEIVKSTISNIQKAISHGFTVDDYLEMYESDISISEIEKHITFLKQGFTKKLLNKPATCGDGISKFDEALIADYATLFEHEAHYYTCEKFVPASGAASRMFGFLSKFLTDYNPETDCIETYIHTNNADDLKIFILNLHKLPFYNDVNQIIRQHHSDYDTWNMAKKQYHFVAVMLNDNFLSYSCKPKGVLPFHNYNGKSCTPVEEHIQEAFDYALSNNQVRLHFTVTDQHQSMFEHIVSSISDDDSNKLVVNYSYQEKSTDTIALDDKNQPFRNADKKLHLRPSGHGALINNLNKLDSDIIFIKNIDNVACKNTNEVSLYKKALAGLLLELQSEVFSYLNNFESSEVSTELLQHTISFAKEELNIQIPRKFYSETLDVQKRLLADLLMRPIRVCGMVKNQGEPGGGPFWVNDNGSLSLQIIETSQIDLDNSEQKKILESATHFNPVDLVCGVKNYKGEKFDLLDFVDHNSGFVVQKNVEGVQIKAYELPGLWNGAMANWISVFVEVPQSTFNPVKTVNDLLKPAHQP